MALVYTPPFHMATDAWKHLPGMRVMVGDTVRPASPSNSVLRLEDGADILAAVSGNRNGSWPCVSWERGTSS